MKKIVFMLSVSLLFLWGCSKIKEKKDEAATALVEKTMEAVSGKKIDMADAGNIDKNKVEVNVMLGGKNINEQFKTGFGSITASKETIAITITGGENGQDNILIGFTGQDLTSERPIKGEIVKGGNSGFTFSMMTITDNGAETLVSFEAEGEIIALNQDKTVIKVKGNLSSTLDADNRERWKPYEGIITLNYPVFQAIGSSKEEFIY